MVSVTKWLILALLVIVVIVLGVSVGLAVRHNRIAKSNRVLGNNAVRMSILDPPIDMSTLSRNRETSEYFTLVELREKRNSISHDIGYINREVLDIKSKMNINVEVLKVLAGENDIAKAQVITNKQRGINSIEGTEMLKNYKNLKNTLVDENMLHMKKMNEFNIEANDKNIKLRNIEYMLSNNREGDARVLLEG